VFKILRGLSLSQQQNYNELTPVRTAVAQMQADAKHLQNDVFIFGTKSFNDKTSTVIS